MYKTYIYFIKCCHFFIILIIKSLQFFSIIEDYENTMVYKLKASKKKDTLHILYVLSFYYSFEQVSERCYLNIMACQKYSK